MTIPERWEPSDGGRWASVDLRRRPLLGGGTGCWVRLVVADPEMEMTPTKATELATALHEFARRSGG